MDDWEPPPFDAGLAVEPLRQAHVPLPFGGSQQVALQVSDGLLLLTVGDGGPDDSPWQPGRLLLSVGFAHAYLQTGAQDHVVDVEVRVHQGPRPAADGWDEQDEADLHGDGPALCVTEMYSHSYARWTLPQGGPWRLRASRRGADRSRRLASTSPDGSSREAWLLELWPAAGVPA